MVTNDITYVGISCQSFILSRKNHVFNTDCTLDGQSLNVISQGAIASLGDLNCKYVYIEHSCKA